MDDAQDQLLEQIDEAVKTGPGWFVIAVGEELGETATPFFAYTTGRACQGRPELIVSGPISPRTAHGVIGAAIARIDELGLGAADLPPDGRTLTDVLEHDYRVLLKAVEPRVAADYTTFAFAYQDFVDRPVAEVEIIEIILPDPQGRFPGDPENSAPPQLNLG